MNDGTREEWNPASDIPGCVGTQRMDIGPFSAQTV